MSSKEEQYKELFIGEALNNLEELNHLLTSLEKNTGDKNVIDAIFRITHTLKGNATGMGFEDISELSHVLEDLFEAIKYNKISIGSLIFNDLFKTIDILGSLVDALKTEKKVSYKGLKTKLEVFLTNQLKHNETIVSETKSELVSDKKIPQKNTVKSQIEDSKKNKPAKKSIPKKPPIIIDDKDEPVTEVITPIPQQENLDTSITFSDMVQIPVRKLDNLLNLVGELTIERDRLAAAQHSVNSEFSLLNRISSDLQYSVMDVRLVQVGFLFNKFLRIVRDAATIEGKNVNLKLEGTETEIDRNVLQVISDSLIHLVRNAVAHGIESPEERKKMGKSEEGKLTLRARSERDSMIIEIEDDGKGIDSKIIKKKAVEKGLLSSKLADSLTDQESIMFIFEPGFSSTEKVNSISGRGVGMDVVKKAIDSIGGSIDINTNVGKGTIISLYLPSSMTVKASLLLELGREVFAIPLVYTEAVLSVQPKDIKTISHRAVTDYLGRTIAVISLKEILFNRKQDMSDLDEKKKIQIAVVSYNNQMFGLLVDKLLQQKEIVEKPLQNPLDKVKSISGVTIMGNGNVCLVLNIPVIMNRFLNFSMKNERFAFKG